MGETVAEPLLANLFRFLGSSLEYPQDAWLNEEYLNGLGELLVELDWREELAEIRQLPSDPVLLLEALQVEYTRLFINAVPSVIAPPYGSVHRQGEGMLNGRSTESTREFYRRHGFDLAGSNALADYLPLELEFMARLLESGREEVAEEFSREIFRPWFTVFRDRVRNGARLPFYGIIVEMIDFFTKEED